MPRLINLLKLLVMLAVALPGVALASTTAGTVKGVTVDEGGLPIPAVLITLTSDNLMGQRQTETCLLYTSPSPRDATLSRMPSSA